MRARDLKQCDLGLMPGDAEWLRKLYSIPENRPLLYASAREACPELAELLVISLIWGVSYDRMCVLIRIPLNINDFYLYRRKALALFKRKIMENNKTP